MKDRKPRSIKDVRHLNLGAHGVAFVEQAIAPEEIALLKEASDYNYELIVKQTQSMGSISAGNQSNNELAALLAQTSARWGGMPMDKYLALAAPEKTKLASVYAAVLEDIRELLQTACGKPAQYKSEISYMRRHISAATYLPWHFDSYAAGTIEFDPCYNVWVPLDPVGVDCPSLEFAVGSHQEMRGGAYKIGPEPKLVDTGSGFAIQPGSPGSEKPGWPAVEWTDDYIDENNHVCVALSPGDIVIFDHYTLHRTQSLPASGVIRTSAELRFSTKQDI